MAKSVRFPGPTEPVAHMQRSMAGRVRFRKSPKGDRRCPFHAREVWRYRRSRPDKWKEK